MKAKITGMCRGDGKAYVKLRVEGAAGTLCAQASVADGDRRIPCNVQRIDEEDGAYVAVVPLFDVPSVTVTLVPCGESVAAAGESCTVSIDMRSLAWRSKAAYAFKRGLVGQIRDIDMHPESTAFAVRHVFTVEESDTAIFRFSCTSRAIDSQHIDWRVIGADGCALPSAQVIPMGRAEISDLPGGVACCEHVVSVRVPLPGGGLCLCAHDMQGRMQDGFCYLDAITLRDAIENRRRETMSAAEDPAYGAWLQHHRATPDEMQSERHENREGVPSFTAVVFGVGSDAAYRTSYESLQRQTYAPAHIVRAADDMAAACAQVADDFIVFVECGDTLEPNALHAYARIACTNNQADVLYCDEDRLDATGTPTDACFKPDWSPNLLRSYHYIGHMLAIRANMVQSMNLVGEPLRDQYTYDIALRAAQTARVIAHVPQVLYHAAASSSYPGSARTAQEDRQGAASLQAHLARMGVEGTVHQTRQPGRYRIEYAVATDALVSVIIPNKDQVDLLRACVESLLHTATYPNIEVIVVENNSTQPETWAYYRQMAADDARVHVVDYTKAHSSSAGAPSSFNFSALVNFGASCAHGAYLLLLNNDTEAIAPDFIQQMLGLFAYSNVGVVGGKLLYRDNTVQHAGVVIGAFGAASHLHYNIAAEKCGYFGRASVVQDLSCVTGACQLIARSVFDAVGGYTEAFQVGFNDVDFCLKVRALGKLVVFTPYALLHHYEYASRGRDESAEKKARSNAERDLLQQRWPQYFSQGDPYYNFNLNPDSLYFGLKTF